MEKPTLWKRVQVYGSVTVLSAAWVFTGIKIIQFQFYLLELGTKIAEHGCPICGIAVMFAGFALTCAFALSSLKVATIIRKGGIRELYKRPINERVDVTVNIQHEPNIHHIISSTVDAYQHYTRIAPPPPIPLTASLATMASMAA